MTKTWIQFEKEVTFVKTCWGPPLLELNRYRFVTDKILLVDIMLKIADWNKYVQAIYV